MMIFLLPISLYCELEEKLVFIFRMTKFVTILKEVVSKYKLVTIM